MVRSQQQAKRARWREFDGSIGRTTPVGDIWGSKEGMGLSSLYGTRVRVQSRGHGRNDGKDTQYRKSIGGEEKQHRHPGGVLNRREETVEATD